MQKDNRDAKTEMTEMLELFDKDFKPAMIKILEYAITNMFGQMKIKLKVSAKKSSLDGLNNRMEGT